MAKGGKRPGAGRPKGAISKSTLAIRNAAESAGEMPIDYMLRVMRDDHADSERRDDMAKAAAPYLHPKLAAIEHSSDPERPVKVIYEWLPPSE